MVIPKGKLPFPAERKLSDMVGPGPLLQHIPRSKIPLPGWMMLTCADIDPGADNHKLSSCHNGGVGVGTNEALTSPVHWIFRVMLAVVESATLYNVSQRQLPVGKSRITWAVLRLMFSASVALILPLLFTSAADRERGDKDMLAVKCWLVCRASVALMPPEL